MGVEYERWLIARGNVFHPSADAIVKLVAKLRAEGWLHEPGAPELSTFQFKGRREQHGQQTGAYAVRRVENTFGDGPDALFAKIAGSTESVPAGLDAAWVKDPSREDMRLVWLVSADKTTLKYPLTRRPEGPVHYSFEIHRASDFIYPISDSIDELVAECRCGNDLAYEWDDDEFVNPFGAASCIATECTECSRTFDPSKVTARVENPFDGSEDKVPGGAAYQFAIKIDCGKNVVQKADLCFAPELVELMGKEFGRNFYEVGSTY
jgi:hypothetical protein